MSNTISSIVLECIDGQDDKFKVEIPVDTTFTLVSTETDPDHGIMELEGDEGMIVFSVLNGLLQVDATGCNTEVKINGRPVSKDSVDRNDVLRIKRSIWRVHYPETAASGMPKANFLSKELGTLVGFEGRNDLSLRTVFSNVFRKHKLSDMEDQLITGTTNNTPPITDIETSWGKPWLFSRLLLLAVILTAILVFGFDMFQNENLIPAVIFIGSFAMPLATLIFFLEMNAPRNISIFLVIVLLFIGGVASLILALVFFQYMSTLSDWLGASAAGIIEETAKLLIVVGIFGRAVRYKWGLNGLLFGAAIGCGFGAFESAGYAFRIILQNGMDEGVNNILLRGLLAPFMHIVWTANAAGALWLVKGDKKFTPAMLASPKFLRVMIASMALHMLWNANFTILPLPVIIDIKFPLLGILAWAICFRLIGAGLKQLNEARGKEVERLQAL